MAVTCYCGLMGSGKSFEAVKSQVVPALRSGRRVVSNIDGLNFERIRDYLGPLKDGELLQPDRLVLVDTDRIAEPGFFRVAVDDSGAVVQSGDLVVLDEVWNFWGDGEKLSQEHRTFIRMHRHYVDARGVSCDIVILIQDLGSLDGFVKRVVSMTHQCRKHTTLGFANRYSVDTYEGRSLRKSNLVSSTLYRYDKAIFPLYKSYDGESSGEKITDKRAIIWRSPKFITAAVAAVLLLGISGTASVRMFIGFFDGSMATRFIPKGLVPDALRSATPGAGGNAQDVAPAQPPGVLRGYAELGSGGVVMWIEGRDGQVVRVEADAGVIDGSRTVLGYQGRMYALAR